MGMLKNHFEFWPKRVSKSLTIPVEVESMMYKHPAIHSVCVIASPDPRRGETVKALGRRTGYQITLRASNLQVKSIH